MSSPGERAVERLAAKQAAAKACPRCRRPLVYRLGFVALPTGDRVTRDVLRCPTCAEGAPNECRCDPLPGNGGVF